VLAETSFPTVGYLLCIWEMVSLKIINFEHLCMREDRLLPC
jgi:hypothetical protein